MHLHSSDAHSVSHGSATPSEIVKRYFLSSKIFSCYSRSYPAQPRTSVVIKPEQNLVLLVRDPGTPHVQSVPELTGHFGTGRCPLSLTPRLGWIPSTSSSCFLLQSSAEKQKTSEPCNKNHGRVSKLKHGETLIGQKESVRSGMRQRESW